MSTDLAPRLKGRYKSEIAPALKVKFGYKNVMQIPTLTKVVVNMGVGEAARDDLAGDVLWTMAYESFH